MIDLAALWLILWLLKNATMDVSCAINKIPNPRYELKKAKARAAGQNPPAQPRYGGRDWFNDLLADGLQAQTEWRRRKADEKRRAREADDREPDNDQPTDDQPTDDEPKNDEPKDDEPKDDEPKDDEPKDDEPKDDEPKDDEPKDEEPAGDGDGTDSGPKARTWSWSCRRPGCPGKGFGFDTEQQARDNAAAHRCVDPQTTPDEEVPDAGPDPQTSESADGGAAGPEQSPQSPRPTEAPGDGPDAQVIPFRKPNQQEEPPVSTTDINTEVQGLDQSIAYARSLATFAGEHATSGNEGYISHLTGAKVEGDGLSTAAEMQEAFANAEAAAEAHAVELERQKAVQEAYDASPDAGDKDFQTEGR